MASWIVTPVPVAAELEMLQIPFLLTRKMCPISAKRVSSLIGFMSVLLYELCDRDMATCPVVAPLLTPDKFLAERGEESLSAKSLLMLT